MIPTIDKRGKKEKRKENKQKETFRLPLRRTSISVCLTQSSLSKIAQFSPLPHLLAKIISWCKETFTDLMVVGRGDGSSEWSPLHSYKHTQVGQGWSRLVPGARWLG